MKSILKLAAVTAAVSVGMAHGAASAAMKMEIFDGTSTILVTDNGVGDQSPQAGAITFLGSIGIWTINVDTGISKPILGTATNPHMDLNFVDVSSRAGDLRIRLTDTGFSSVSRFFAEVGGTLGGGAGSSVTYKTYASAANVEFGTTTLLSSQVFTGSPYSGSATAAGLSLGTNFSLTQEITIHHAGAGSTSGDAALVPEPASAALLGIGALAFGLAGGRKRRQAKA